jgi:hypothetical protein
VPEGIAAVIHRMMMKDPAARYQSPADVVAALAPYTTTPIPPPSEDELPKLSPAAQAPGGSAAGIMASGRHAVPRASLAQRLSSGTSSATHVPLSTSPPPGPPPNPASQRAIPRQAAAAVASGRRLQAATRDDSNPFAPLLTASGTSPALDQSAQQVYATAAARAGSLRGARSSAAASERGAFWLVVLAAVVAIAAGVAAWKYVLPLPPKPAFVQATIPRPDGLTGG